MSPLPAADTSTQVDRPAVVADSPTARTQVATRAPAEKRKGPGRGQATAPQGDADPLGAPMHQFTTRASEAVLELLKERAAAVADALPPELRGGGPGGAVRMVITDALIGVLELDVDEHVERIRQTRGRELMAQAKAKIGG
jgi:hypothetical protein